MVSAWVVTIPGAGLLAATAWQISDIFSNKDAGAIVMVALTAMVALGLFLLAQRTKVTARELDRTQVAPEAESGLAATPA
jgi:phosphate/sulfate permease